MNRRTKQSSSTVAVALVLSTAWLSAGCGHDVTADDLRGSAADDLRGPAAGDLRGPAREQEAAAPSRQAEAVRRYLNMQHGIPLHRMSVISYGESSPVTDNDTKEGRAQNRRVSLVVLM